MEEAGHLRIVIDGKPGFLSVFESAESVTVGGSFELASNSSPSRPLFAVPVYYVLQAKLDGNQLHFAYLKHVKKKPAVLVRHVYTIMELDTVAVHAREWCQKVMSLAYEGVTTQRRLKVIVNPHSGKGKSVSIYNKTVQPILSLADCAIDATFTERPKHACEIAQALPLDFDAIVICSGDGLLHEIYNGFAEHDDPIRAFSIPVAPIPTGSANGTCLNLLGLEAGFDPGLATLNAIKGKPMRLDVSSVTIGDQRIFSYMSQAIGLVADADLGTESLRWMGDIRFILGYVAGALKMKPFPMTLEIKTAETDKDKMLEEFRARSEAYQQQLQESATSEAGPVEGPTRETEVDKNALPALKHVEEPHEDSGWTKFDKPVLYLYAGKCPWVSRDLMQFPVAHPSDGYIDVVVQEIIGRLQALALMDGAEKGTVFFQDHQHYFKAHAYRVTPHESSSSTGNGSDGAGTKTKRWISIDGEQYPLQQFTVEVHRGLGALLSPTPGVYAHADEFAKIQPQAKVQRGTTSEQPKRNPGLGFNASNVSSTAADDDAESDLKKQSKWRRLIDWCQ